MERRVLILSSDEEKVKEIQKAFAAQNFNLKVASEGIVGIEAATYFRPEVIILSLVSSSDGGLAIVEKLKSTPATQLIPIVILMAMETDEYTEQVKKFGIESLIPKPFDAKLILQEVKNIFATYKPPPKKIMIVDDDPILIKMLNARLTANGYRVIALNGGEEMIKKVHTEFPDLIVLDIMMPNVSGWSITQELKANKDLRNIPVILLSSMIEKEGKATKFEIGDYFLSKPVMMEKLLERIKEYLEDPSGAKTDTDKE